jgi:thiosulfate dehydrogenase
MSRLLFIITVILIIPGCASVSENQPEKKTSAPDEVGNELVKYGKELIANTAYYLGPKGKIATLTNGMNCQNCHLQAGTQFYANSYLAVATNYPRFSPRSGGSETLIHKINDCMERSLNGQKLDTSSREMRAMVVYIKSIDNNDIAAKAANGTQQLSFLSRAANASNGNILYQQKCFSCHGQNGEGRLAIDSATYIYPPLWGVHSYNVSAGIFRISKLAGFIKNNMPFGATYLAPQLTEEQAWDIAAFINSQPRPQKRFNIDWPNISKKPIDYPFAPYNDHFTETQHKYGPYQPMEKEKKEF